jgi:hypothetical protein
VRGSRLIGGRSKARRKTQHFKIRVPPSTLGDLKERRNYVRAKINVALKGQKGELPRPVADLQFNKDLIKQWENEVHDLDRRIEKVREQMLNR